MLSTTSSQFHVSSLSKAVSAFLVKHHDPARPLLLGLSGGPDSLALLHILLEVRKTYPFSLGLAHIDHGWRAESGEEARLLQQMARALELPFHLKRLQAKDLEGNLEDVCREERLNFFRELCHLHNYQAVFLAHHADDQAETVLKRVLEGANLAYLSGMRPESHVKGVCVFRPLLHVKKVEIISWLNSRGLKGFEDHTNLDQKFLRGKFRTRILPLLTAEFGKGISGSLEKLGTEAQELRDYLDSRVNSALNRIEETSSGLFLDFNEEKLGHPFELRYLIRKFCEKGKVNLSREALQTVLKLLLSQAADKQIELLKIDRGILFLPKMTWKPIQDRFPLHSGESSIGDWNIAVKEWDDMDKKSVLGWKEAWRGRIETWLPLEEGENYEIGGVVLNASLSKKWTNAKVPAFLRQSVPVIWKKDQIFHEFLSGQERKIGERKIFVFVKKWLHVVLERK